VYRCGGVGDRRMGWRGCVSMGGLCGYGVDGEVSTILLSCVVLGLCRIEQKCIICCIYVLPNHL
jgi:hypothetical protein